jgi:hypothetical protein
VIHRWFYKSGEGLLAALWLADEMKVALMVPTFVPDPDVHDNWSDVAGSEVAGPGYTAGGLVLTGKAAPYTTATDRTDLQAADSVWGPGATFSTRYAVVYDNTPAGKPLWSYVDFEATKDVDNGTFTIDWSSVSLLHLVPV